MSYANRPTNRPNNRPNNQVPERPPRSLIGNVSEWIIYIHGGNFNQWTPVDAGYAQLSANIAAGAEMGVLAIDYRTTTWRQQDSGWPYPMEDTLAAAQWLRDNGATKIFLTGDSTGASQAIQTMIYNIEERKNVTIDGAVTFSAWTDFTCSSATYQYDIPRAPFFFGHFSV